MRSEAFWKWFDEHAAPRLAKDPKMARDATFRKMFEHLDKFDRPVRIVETGCVEDPDNWSGNGCSTILFDKYVETHKACFAVSIEIVREKVEMARGLCKNVTFLCGDSVDLLRSLATGSVRIDLLYLDASHHNWISETPSQVHHYQELMAVMPCLHEDTLVAVDDSLICLDDYPQSRIMGKGGLVAQYALEVGADFQFCDYQVGFTGMTRKAPDITGLPDIIRRARELVEKGDPISSVAADRLYRLVMYLTIPPWSGPQRMARGEACENFARKAHQAKKYGIATDWWWMALEAVPIASELRKGLVLSLVAQGAMQSAKRQAQIGVEINPKHSDMWAVLGGVSSDLMDTQGTIEAYDGQVEAAASEDDPVAYSNALHNRATIALDTQDYDTVRALARLGMEVGVHKGDAWHLLAMTEYRLSNHEKAIEYFEKALANDCRNKPLCHWNYANPLHSIGRLKEGWEHHSWGEHETTLQALYIPQHRFALPKWRGDEPATIREGITSRKAIVHVHHEAGFGDNISMWRYFPLMIERGFEVHYESDPLTLSLVARNFPDVVCMARTKDYPGVVGMMPADYHIPVGDLPHAFGTDIDTVPWNGPYLKPDPFKAADFATILRHEAEGKRRKIGLCWSSGIRKTIDIWLERYGRMKSMHFSDLAPLANNDDFFVSLMVGDGRSDHKGLIADLLPAEPTFDDTAALIANLDLVITVDTAVAHLAGAMGKETWVMMQRDGASWHFMCWRPGAPWNEASPWYPSVRIFRQHEFNTPGYWKDVVGDVAKALECSHPALSDSTQAQARAKGRPSHRS